MSGGQVAFLLVLALATGFLFGQLLAVFQVRAQRRHFQNKQRELEEAFVSELDHLRKLRDEAIAGRDKIITRQREGLEEASRVMIFVRNSLSDLKDKFTIPTEGEPR